MIHKIHLFPLDRSETIKEKNEQQKELSKGLTKLHDQLERLDTYVDTHRAARKFIRENDIEIAKLKSSVTELEKFNAKLQQEINILTSGTVSEDDTKKLCLETVEKVGASSIKDMGKVMGELKKNYSNNLDFSKAGQILKEILNKK